MLSSASLLSSASFPVRRGGHNDEQRDELEAKVPSPAQEGVNRLRRDKDNRRHFAFAHLLQGDLMGNEGLVYVDAESAEDQRT